MKRLIGFILVFVLFPLSLSAQEAAVPQKEPVLLPGDSLRILVWRRPEMSGSFAVSADGTLRHPLYLGVNVVGAPPTVLRERVRQVLEQYQAAPEFVLEPMMRVSVTGEIEKPGLYTVSPELTVSQLVALSGGVTPRGRLDRVHLIRDGASYLLDLKRPDALSAALPVRSGDRFVIGRRSTVARETITLVTSSLSVVTSVTAFVFFLTQ